MTRMGVLWWGRWAICVAALSGVVAEGARAARPGTPPAGRAAASLLLLGMAALTALAAVTPTAIPTRTVNAMIDFFKLEFSFCGR